MHFWPQQTTETARGRVQNCVQGLSHTLNGPCFLIKLLLCIQVCYGSTPWSATRWCCNDGSLLNTSVPLQAQSSHEDPSSAAFAITGMLLGCQLGAGGVSQLLSCLGDLLGRTATGKTAFLCSCNISLPISFKWCAELLLKW